MCTEAKARYLLDHGHAVVHKMYPFTIRLKKNLDSEPCLKDCRIKIDPGSKFTGVAIVDECSNVVFLAEIEHRGDKISSDLKSRHDVRRNRRQRKTRYRRCKFINHYLKKGSKYKTDSNRPEGWLPPSIESVEQNIINFVKKVKKLCNITSISVESVKFDSQLMDNPNISGVEYQQGTLFGYEIREYLLEKYGHVCQYCGGESKDSELQIEHMHSRKNNGSNSIKNLSIACKTCNNEKDSYNLEQWLDILKSSKKIKLNAVRIERIESILKDGKVYVQKKYSAWVTSYRWRLVNDLKCLFDSIELTSGGRTKFNRINLKLSKEHYYDALCVGRIPEKFKFKTEKVLCIKSYGRGSRQMSRVNKYGFMHGKPKPRQKLFFGYQTGDIVKANVTEGKKTGRYFGRVAARSTGYFNIQMKEDVVQGIKYDTLKLIQRNDGYSYNIKDRNKEIS